MRKGEKRVKTNIGVGTSVTVMVRDIYEKIRESKIIRMRKELVDLYYLAHIASVLVFSRFWWLLPLFIMVYIQ